VSDWAGALVVLVCTLTGTLAGNRLAGVLPRQHLAYGSKDAIKLGMGLTASITALILALVTASAKSDFDTCDRAIRRSAADVLMLDRALDRYGPETVEIRAAIRTNFSDRIDLLWPEESSGRTGRRTAPI